MDRSGVNVRAKGNPHDFILNQIRAAIFPLACLFLDSLLHFASLVGGHQAFQATVPCYEKCNFPRRLGTHSHYRMACAPPGFDDENLPPVQSSTGSGTSFENYVRKLRNSIRVGG